MSTSYIFIMIAVMAVVTYLIRMLPVVVFRNEIKSPFVRDCLYYMPYAVLSAMTIPQIFYSAGALLPSLVGTLTAVILAFFKKPLILVAVSACAAAYVCSIIITLLK